MATLRVSVLDNDLKMKYLQKSQYESDIGFDIFTPTEYNCPPNSKMIIKLGLKCQLVDNSGNDLAYMLVARSSIHKYNVLLCNSVGIIDPGYRGEICAVVYNYSADVQKIEKFDRLFQLVAFSGMKMNVDLNSKLDYNTQRSENGFGSTGT